MRRRWCLRRWCALGATALVFAACTGPRPVPPLPAGASAVGVVRSSTGVVVALLAPFDGGSWVRTPCYGVTVLHDTTAIGPTDVLLDPGHGGDEEGAIGPNGLKEKDLNLAVARRVRDRLVAKRRSVVLTRDADVRAPIRTRGELGAALKPRVLVSIHHNASGPPPRKGRPGTEVYHQIASEDSARLAGFLWDDLTSSLGRFDIEWSADDDHPGPKSRAGENGDYYGVLRYAGPVPAVITEAAFITSAAEADLLATETFRDTEADAIAGAIDRYLATPAPASTTSEGSTSTSIASATEPRLPATTASGSTPTNPSVAQGPAPDVPAELPARPPDADGCTDPALE